LDILIRKIILTFVKYDPQIKMFSQINFSLRINSSKKNQFYLNVTLFHLFTNTINCLFQQDCFLLKFFSVSDNLILEDCSKILCKNVFCLNSQWPYQPFSHRKINEIIPKKHTETPKESLCIP
jgi:hypothetical protein